MTTLTDTARKRRDRTDEITVRRLKKQTRPQGEIHAATWLSPSILVLVCTFDGAFDESDWRARIGRRRAKAVFACFSYLAKRATTLKPVRHTVLICRFDDTLLAYSEDLKLVAKSSEHRISIGYRQVAPVCGDLKQLIRHELVDLDGSVRMEILSWFAFKLELPKQLQLLRDALRERLPECVVERDCAQAVQVESLIKLDGRAFWIKGWARDGSGVSANPVLISPEGAQVQLAQGVFRHRRLDVEQFYGLDQVSEATEFGFISYFELPIASQHTNGWVAQLKELKGTVPLSLVSGDQRGGSGSLGLTGGLALGSSAMGVECAVPPVVDDPDAARTAILADLELFGDQQVLLERHAMPALNRLQNRVSESVSVADVFEFGCVSKPQVSIVIPLYRQLNFVEHQLAHFANDPDIRRSELIYVLDSPEDVQQLLKLGAQLHNFYNIAFKIVVLSRNGGFSRANNLGAQLAVGDYLLLLNSDVIPDKASWLTTMTTAYRKQRRIGALGVKLLYEDDSLQHAGMYFRRPDAQTPWENAHFFKGMHRSLAQANVARPVPAVTGACLLVDRALYNDVGGLSGSYIQGDYEDSDLCLRLHSRGLENWYLPDVELYHLEAQSYPGELRRQASRYNRWLHTYLFNDEIEQLMRTFDGCSSELRNGDASNSKRRLR